MDRVVWIIITLEEAEVAALVRRRVVVVLVVVEGVEVMVEELGLFGATMMWGA